MLTNFELNNLYFTRYLSKVNFLQKLSSSFSKLDIFKMSIFEKLTTSFVGLFQLFLFSKIFVYFIECLLDN